ncbi:MAG TPA: endonuclease/exonuclease/phosphatase family protein [Opitutales bacterium]|nr:endonuclease/exonuclease/phosphatase family protein [Opitutales bacterium]
MKNFRPILVTVLLALAGFASACSQSEHTAAAIASTAPANASSVTLRLATYNVRNYNLIDRRIDGEFKPKWPKPETEKTALRAVICAAHPDILALEEMGLEPELEELRRDLASEGLTYTYSVLVHGPDPDRHVAILSRVPLAAVHPHESITYKSSGVTKEVSRGLLEVDIVTNGQPWALYVVHLKSRLTESSDDPQSAAQRDSEATALRNIVRQEQSLANGAFVAVVGDFNDSRDSPALKRFTELDAKPLLTISPDADSHGETWTSSYGRADEYDRSDYILLSPALAPLRKSPGGIEDIPASADASDHRLVWVDLTFAK